MSQVHIVNGTLDVPVIDISAFVTSAETDQVLQQREHVASAVEQAARTVGSMQIVGHGISDDTLHRFTAAMDAFFALSPEAKGAYQCPPETNRGYTPPRSERLAYSLGIQSSADLFEAFNIGSQAPDDAASLEFYAANVWPDSHDFYPAVSDYYQDAGRVARTMVEIFCRALGLSEDAFAEATRDSIDTLRMINYQLPSVEVELEPDQVGMGAHTDYGIVTVLWADDVPGLEVLGGDGHWYPVRPARGALLINLGDAIARWTNDKWISTIHRVAAPRVNGELVRRRSAAFFHDGNPDAIIAPLPSCVDSDRPAAYEPITVREHLRAKLAGSRGGILTAGAEREASRIIRA